MYLQQQITFKKADKILKRNGYRLKRINGSHCIYSNSDNDSLAITIKLNPCVWNNVVKNHNIVV